MQNKEIIDIINFLNSQTITKRVNNFKKTTRNSSSIKYLDEYTKGEQLFQKVQKSLFQLEDMSHENPNRLRNNTYIKKMLLQSKILYITNRISREEYIASSLTFTEAFHDNRWDSDFYSSRLNNIKKTSKKCDEIYEQTYIETLREFQLNDLADLKEKSKKKFENLQERSRRACYHKGLTPESLKDSIFQYEHEAIKASKSGAFLAGITALAAALEGILLLLCIKFEKKAVESLEKLKNSGDVPKRSKNIITNWSFDILIKVCSKSGWIRNINTKNYIISSESTTTYLRKMRNYIHPARQCKDRSWIITSKKDYKLSESLYHVVVSDINKKTKILK